MSNWTHTGTTSGTYTYTGIPSITTGTYWSEEDTMIQNLKIELEQVQNEKEYFKSKYVTILYEMKLLGDELQKLAKQENEI